MAITASPLAVPLDKTKTFHSSLLNHALSLDSLCTTCSMCCPLSLMVNPWRSPPGSGIMSTDSLRKFHQLSYEVNFHRCLLLYNKPSDWEKPNNASCFVLQASLPYHSSAIMASALETSSLLYRVDHSPHTLGSLTDSLTQRGRKVHSIVHSIIYSHTKCMVSSIGLSKSLKADRS